MSEPTLPNCPYCGAAGEIERYERYGKVSWRCRCSAGCNNLPWQKTRKAAIENWSRRAPQPKEQK